MFRVLADLYQFILIQNGMYIGFLKQILIYSNQHISEDTDG